MRTEIGVGTRDEESEEESVSCWVEVSVLVAMSLSVSLCRYGGRSLWSLSEAEVRPPEKNRYISNRGTTTPKAIVISRAMGRGGTSERLTGGIFVGNEVLVEGGRAGEGAGER